MHICVVHMLSMVLLVQCLRGGKAHKWVCIRTANDRSLTEGCGERQLSLVYVYTYVHTLWAALRVRQEHRQLFDNVIQGNVLPVANHDRFCYKRQGAVDGEVACKWLPLGMSLIEAVGHVGVTVRAAKLGRERTPH